MDKAGVEMPMVSRAGALELVSLPFKFLLPNVAVHTCLPSAGEVRSRKILNLSPTRTA